MKILRATILATVMSLFVESASAGTNEIIGTYANWPGQWAAISSLNDPDDGLTRDWLDFVGDASNPGAYWAYNSDYIFFRARVDAGTVLANTFSDSLFVLIDKVGYGVENGPDFAFTWDSKSGDNTRHGLEMSMTNVNGVVWSGTRMDDLDGSGGLKLANDINGSGRATDGYLRTIDGQSTVNFGTTAFVDYAVSWSYLQAYTPLGSNQLWRFALASIANANDHNLLDYDVAGNVNPSANLTSGWSPSIFVPEPGAIVLLAAGTFSLLFRRHRARRG